MHMIITAFGKKNASQIQQEKNSFAFYNQTNCFKIMLCHVPTSTSTPTKQALYQ